MLGHAAVDELAELIEAFRVGEVDLVQDDHVARGLRPSESRKPYGACTPHSTQRGRTVPQSAPGVTRHDPAGRVSDRGTSTGSATEA